MLFETNIPFYTINRWGEKIIASEDWIIKTENKEAINVLNYLFAKPKKEEPKKEEPKKEV